MSVRFIYQAPGVQIWSASGSPPPTTGNDGDLYIDSSNGNYYIKLAGSWGSPQGSLRGPTGSTGSAGSVGAAGPTGAAGAGFNPSGPSTQTFVSGTAFQPSATKATALTVFAVFNALVSINSSVVVSMSATQAGTYTTVASSSINLSISLLTLGGSLGAVIIPVGWWVKIVVGTNATATAIIQTIS